MVTRLIQYLDELGVRVVMDHWAPSVRGNKEEGTVVDRLVEKVKDEEVLEKLNLCWLQYKALWADDLYQMDGTIYRSKEYLGKTDASLK